MICGSSDDLDSSLLSNLFSDANLTACRQDREREIIRRFDDAKDEAEKDKSTNRTQTRMYRALYSKSSVMKVMKAKIIMEDHGFVILEKRKSPIVIAAKLLQDMKQIAAEIADIITKRLLDIGIDVSTASRKRKRLALNGETQSFKFAEVSSRCYGRLDVRYGMDQAPFNDARIVSKPPWLPLIHSLIGSDAQLKYCGLILSMPGSIDQPYHGDGIHLFGNELQCPIHAVNVFIPLCDISRELGPTEFIPGSHLLSNAAILNDAVSRAEGFSRLSSVAPLLSEGSVMLYDFRTIHRGTGNTHQSQCRHMFYMLYAKPWFSETINFGSLSVFSPSANSSSTSSSTGASFTVVGEDAASAGYRDFDNMS
jgi:ectoine hydroxylase-related dioxygenase (phytanoyl-CoA dioxygenase family)